MYVCPVSVTFRLGAMSARHIAMSSFTVVLFGRRRVSEDKDVQGILLYISFCPFFRQIARNPLLQGAPGNGLLPDPTPMKLYKSLIFMDTG